MQLRFGSLGKIAAALVALALAVAPAAATQSNQADIFGLWLTEKEKVLIELYPCGDEVCGKIAWLYKQRHKHSGKIRRDTLNPDPALRERAWCGIEVIEGLEPDSNGGWEDGKFYYPKDGGTYRLELKPDGDGRIEAHAYLGLKLFGKTETWTRPGPDFQPYCEAES